MLKLVTNKRSTPRNIFMNSDKTFSAKIYFDGTKKGAESGFI